MQRDAVLTRPVPTRAEIARLSLDLRSIDLQVAEAEQARIRGDLEREIDIAVGRLRERLAKVVTARQEELDRALDTARAEAAASIDAARHASALALRDAPPPIEHVRIDRVAVDPIVVPAVEPLRIVESMPPVDLDDAPTAAGTTCPRVVDLAPPTWAPLRMVTTSFDSSGDDDDAFGTLHWLDEPTAPLPVEQPVLLAPLAPASVEPTVQPMVQPSTMMVDSDAFARAFALAFAQLAKDGGFGFGAAAPSTTRSKADRPSFWSAARHPDVLLIALATIVLLVIVAAWLA